jgi:hypothetical protein
MRFYSAVLGALILPATCYPVCAQEVAAEADRQLAAVLASLDTTTLVDARWMIFNGAEFPILGLSGKEMQADGSAVQYFIPCGGKKQQVSPSDLADTEEWCTGQGSERPTTILVSGEQLTVYGTFASQAYAATALAVEITKWTAQDYDRFLALAKEGTSVTPMWTAKQIDSADTFAVEKYELGGDTYLNLRLVERGTFAPQWTEIPTLSEFTFDPSGTAWDSLS